jgi:1-acyl-sn-glycerol-3-phosphate acyltransferase
MVPVTIIGSGDIIKKGSAVVTPGLVKVIISPPVEPKNNKKENEEILESIRCTIMDLHL